MIRKEEVAKILPEELVEIAFWYANDLEEHLPSNKAEDYLLCDELAKVVNNLDSKALEYLCLSACLLYQKAWSLNCDYPLNRDLESLITWVSEGIKPMDLEGIKATKTPIRNGKEIHDCTYCSLQPISSAVSATANFIESKDFKNAGKVLFNCWEATSEGVIHPFNETFEEWVVLFALPAALNEKIIRLTT